MHANTISNLLEIGPSLLEVCRFFQRSAYPYLEMYVASVEGNEVTLEGVSRSYHSKQIAQNVAGRCPGVKSVRNLIKVEYA